MGKGFSLLSPDSSYGPGSTRLNRSPDKRRTPGQWVPGAVWAARPRSPRLDARKLLALGEKQGASEGFRVSEELKKKQPEG